MAEQPRTPFSAARFLRNALAIALIVACGALVYREWVRPNLFPKNFGVVTEGVLYRSGKLTPAATEKVVREHGIRTIVDLGAFEPGTREERLAQRTADALGVDRVRMDLEGDATGNPNFYAEALRIMTDPERQPVLVQCGAGSERTGCAVAMYRHLVEGVSMDDAYAETQRYKHNPRRNPRLREVFEAWTEPVGRAVHEGVDVPGAEPLNPAAAGSP
ncbi:MAG: tyrosine-protein phosphatase [Phycisphaeraceae bacterium]|nr:tyrosine-protein phosphatase [Phycisphaeraceae bacterium]